MALFIYGGSFSVFAQDDYSRYPFYETGVYKEFNNSRYYQTRQCTDYFEIPCDTGKIRFHVFSVKQVSNSNTKRRVTVYRGSCKYLANRDGRNNDGLLIFSNNKTTLLNLHLLIKRATGIENTSVRIHGVGLMDNDDILICYRAGIPYTQSKLLSEVSFDENGYTIYRYRNFNTQEELENYCYRGIVLNHLDAYRIKEVISMPWLN